MSLFIHKRANAFSQFSCMLIRKYVLISFMALNDRSLVVVVTGNVAKICSNVSMIEYVPSCLAVLRVTLFQLKIQSKYTFTSECSLCLFWKGSCIVPSDTGSSLFSHKLCDSL